MAIASIIRAKIAYSYQMNAFSITKFDLSNACNGGFHRLLCNFRSLIQDFPIADEMTSPFLAMTFITSTKLFRSPKCICLRRRLDASSA